MNEIILKHLEATAFMGIDSSQPLILDFTKAKGRNITLIQGDQGTGKSSSLNAILFCMGAQFGFDASTLINDTDKTMKEVFEFSAKGVNYRLNVTKSRVSLEREVEKDKWLKENEPKAMLREIFGPLGIWPTHLKEAKGKDQIEWFRDTWANDEELKGTEKKLKDNLKKATDSRKDANKEYLRLKAKLEADPLYVDYEGSEKKFAEEKTLSSAVEKLEVATRAKATFATAVEKLARHREDLGTIEGDIERLERELEQKNVALLSKKENILAAEKYIADNVAVQAEFEKAQDEFTEINTYLLQKQLWQTVVREKTEMDQFHDAVVKLDGQKDEIRAKILKMTKKYIPEVDGLEMKVDDGIDADSDDEGIFYNGRTLAQLSESEFDGLFMEIFLSKGVQFVFVENVSVLGTKAIETLNKLAQNDIRVFASLMDRKKPTRKVTFISEID